MKIILITIGIFAVFPAVSSAAFLDIDNTNINKIAIDYLEERGIAEGYADGTFIPAYLATRAQALKMIIVSGEYLLPATITETYYTDVSADDWFAPYVVAGIKNGIITVPETGSFYPERTITRSELIKMVLLAYGFDAEGWDDTQIFSDVPANAWFTPYMNYAGYAGLVEKDSFNNLLPSLAPNRGEVAGIIYKALLIAKKNDNDFLQKEAEKFITQVKANIDSGNVITAKKTSEMLVSITQQMYRNAPANKNVLGKGKLAKAYNYYVNGVMNEKTNNTEREAYWKNLATLKAQEAIQQGTSVSIDAASVLTLLEN